MKKYYLFLIILLAFECSLIAQKAELMKNPSQASNAEAAKMLGTIVPSTITKQQEEAMGDLINQSVKIQEEIIKNQEEEHYCLSFNFVKESGVITKILIYECTECGRQVQILPPDTIENKIADNKRRMELDKARIEALKKMLEIQKSQNVSNQKNIASTSKPQKKSTSTPSTTKKQQSSTKKSTSTPSTTKKQQSSTKKTNVSATKNTTPNAISKSPKPTVEENLGKISDGIDAAIDMVKKICNKDGANNTTLIENYNPIQERALKEANNPLNPVCDPNKEYIATLDDLRELASIMKEKYSFEAESNFGRDVASLKPYSLDEVIYELENGLSSSIAIETGDQYHQDDEINTFLKDPAIMKEIIFGGLEGAASGAASGADVCGLACAVFGGVAGGVASAVAVADKVTLINDPKRALGYLNEMKEKGIKNVKITMSEGREAVYNLDTGKIVMNEKLGTQNFGERGVVSSVFGNHKEKDIDPNDTKAIPGNPFTRDGDQYKYVGILYEQDKKYPGKYYIINGQTGERMTTKQVYEFAATISDMWVKENHQQSVIDPYRDRNMGLWK